MKQIIRLTESDIHRIVEESVKRIIRENSEFSDWEEPAMEDDPNFSRRLNSIRRYWASKGLSGEELERKVQTILRNKSGRH